MESHNIKCHFTVRFPFCFSGFRNNLQSRIFEYDDIGDVDDGDGEDGLNGTNKKPMGGFGLLVLGRVAGWDTGQVHTVKKLHTVTTHCVWRTKDFLSPLISYI